MEAYVLQGSTEREVLPPNLKPIHYDLRFEPHLEDAKSFDGSVSIELEVLQDIDSIVLNVLDLDFISTQVLQSGGSEVQISDIEFDVPKERVIIPFKEKVKKGQKIWLNQKFKGSLLHHTTGFFRSPIDINGKTVWMASTQMEPTSARKVFPCFDEPALKATFTVTLIAEKHLTCLGNMDVASEVDISTSGKEKKAVTFNKTPLMSTYIVAFAVGDLKMIETNSFRVPVRIYAAVDKNIEHGRFCLELASRTLKAFEDMFSIPFPLPKMDLIAVPAAQGAMENWGLVTFGESLLLVDEKETSASAFRTAGSVLVHELAHQWFGNLVTMEFWEGLWLNESFADWAELYAWETLEPSWDMWLDYTASGYQLGLQLDANKASHPVEVPVYKVTQINQIFDAISYNKGCAIIRMIAGLIGVEVFIEGVRTYLQKYAYGNTKTSDLWNALSKASGKDVGKLMETWTKHIGYPVIEVHESAGDVEITQHRFLQDGTANTEDDKILYPVPLAVRSGTGVEEKFLYDRSMRLELSDIFKLNSNQHGFYRVLYSPQRLEILGQNAKDGLLPPEDKIGLLSDALAMATSGYANSKASAVLSLLERFSEEKNFFVWKQIIKTISTITAAWIFEKDAVVSALETFQARLLSKLLEEKGWEFKKEDDTVEQMAKALIFSHSSQDPEVQKAAMEMFEKFLKGDEKAINVNIRNSVFEIALEHGGEKEYESLLSFLKKPTTIDARDIILKSLGSATSPILISRTIDLAMSPSSLSLNTTIKILRPLTKHAAGRLALWDWIRRDFEKVRGIYGNGLGGFARVLKMVVGALGTKEQLSQVESYFQSKEKEGFDRYLEQAVDTVKAKVAWVERDRGDVEGWLAERGFLKDGSGV